MLYIAPIILFVVTKRSSEESHEIKDHIISVNIESANDIRHAYLVCSNVPRFAV